MRPAGPGQRREPGRARRSSTGCWREYPHGAARRLRPGRGPAAGPDGQLRGRPPQHRRRPRRLPGPHAHQPGDRGRQLLREPRPAPGVRQGRGPGQPLHLMGLVSDGGVHSDMGHLEALPRAGARARRSATSSCTPSSTAATRRRGAPRATSPRSRRRMDRLGVGRYGVDQRPLLRHGPRQALGPGQARLRRPGPRRGLLRRRRAGGGATPPTPAARPTSSCGPRSSRRARRRASRDGDVCLFFNFRPDRARELTRAFTEPDFAEFDRGAAPAGVDFVDHDRSTRRSSRCRSPSRRSSPSTCWPRCSPSTGLRQLHIAETEKYAHVTFFFNGGRGEGGRRGGAHPRAQPARRADLRPEAGDERLRRHRRARRAARGRRASTSSSSTTPTPTWSGTPASSPRPSRRSRPSTPAWAGSSTPSLRPRRRLPGHRRPRQLGPHAGAGRQPQHGAQHQPGAVRRHRRRAPGARGRPALRPRADGLALLGVEQPPEMTGADLLEPAG